MFVSFLVAIRRQQFNSYKSMCDSFAVLQSSDHQIKTLCMDHNTFKNVGYIFEPTLLFCMLCMSQMLVSIHTHTHMHSCDMMHVRLHITGGK